jgi:hypothetical protein
MNKNKNVASGRKQMEFEGIWGHYFAIGRE